MKRYALIMKRYAIFTKGFAGADLSNPNISPMSADIFDLNLCNPRHRRIK
jgi:hypothetical protein